MPVISVSQLNCYVSQLISNDKVLQRGILIRGEIIDFTHHYRSGHLYFSLCDEKASIKAVMFSRYAQRLTFTPKNGDRVIVSATVTLYEEKGSYQINVTDIQQEGIGKQEQASEQLKEKLTAMGVFDPTHKRSLPKMPQTIGVVTSDSGAALHDIETVLSRRFPIVTLNVYPAQVQGENAPDAICRAIETARQDACDVLIVGRGGGSSEDLNAFQTEKVVMAIYHCSIPVVSAVGHETDYTLADEAADLRAPTPSAAAEQVVPNYEAIFQEIAHYHQRLDAAIEKVIRQSTDRLNRLTDHLIMHSPDKQWALAQKDLIQLRQTLDNSLEKYLTRLESTLATTVGRLEMLSPLRILQRGYSLVYHKDHIVQDTAQIANNDIIQIHLAHGEITARVIEKIAEKDNKGSELA